jgi:hypothetical protein
MIKPSLYKKDYLVSAAKEEEQDDWFDAIRLAIKT